LLPSESFLMSTTPSDSRDDTRFPPDILRDVAKRRTFAIISHPDAGKTTLTEKLLLFGGAIQLAGHRQGAQERSPCDFGLDGGRESSAASRSPAR
jgi:hypothetical protein